MLNPKGGSGRTTTAVHLAVELARRDARVQLLDADPQGHAVKLLTAPAVLQRFSNLSAAAVRADGTVDQNLSDDWRVMDTAAGDPARWRDWIALADLIVVPTRPDPLGVASVTQLLAQFALAHHRQRLVVLPVACDRHVPTHRQALDALVEHLGSQPVWRPVRPDIRLAQAFGRDQPVQQWAPRSRGAMDHFMLANAVEHFIATGRSSAVGFAGEHRRADTDRSFNPKRAAVR